MLEADACGIGFLASRKGIPERTLVQLALELATRFDHRGAPGHGAGIQLDIPWPLLLDRFTGHVRAIAQRDVALGMFFLPHDPELRSSCVDRIEALAEVAGAEVLEWADVPICPQALPPQSSALRTLPIVRQALFKRPDGMSEIGWFRCRYLLRLALDQELGPISNDQFSVVSLSNRNVVYKGLCELSKIADFYPDLEHPDFASRYVLFHSRYCTNTTTAWRRAQPFWAIAHNGEIATVAGNAAWMGAIGHDLLSNLVEEHPSLAGIAGHVKSIVCPGGSDTANLDDMVIALIAGGMTLPQSILGLLPGSEQNLEGRTAMREFYRATSVYFGACDGPAAIVACDGDNAVAHLDRNGLRPLWLAASKEYVLASSELTGTVDIGEVELQRVLGPGETFQVRLNTGELLSEHDVQDAVVRRKFPNPKARLVEGKSADVSTDLDSERLTRLQIAFGMSKEDVDVLVKPMAQTGKPSLGSMGDDTSPAALLDTLPRRLEDHFALRFAQETSPPIDPVRDAWAFDTAISLGDRRGPWKEGTGPIFRFKSPVLSAGQRAWLMGQPGVQTLWALSPVAAPAEAELQRLVNLGMTTDAAVLIVSDRFPDEGHVAVQPTRLISRLHRALVAAGRRHRVSIVADVGVWDIHHCALLTTLGADAVCPWLGIASAADEAKYLTAVRSGLTEAMSMMGVTPATAYCGAGLVESIALDPTWVAEEFGVPHHLGGIHPHHITAEWEAFHAAAFTAEPPALVDAGEFRHSKDGRKHANNAEIVRSLHIASGYMKKLHAAEPGSREAYDDFSRLVSERPPLTVLDLLKVRDGEAIPLDQVEPLEAIAWRFIAPGMSEGALSEPAHRAVARGLNVLNRYCRLRAHYSHTKLEGIGPIANSGEGGFDKSRVNTRDFNRSVQYAGGRFTITPATAANASEAEVKFAQGAKPGKGGQLPGKKVSTEVAQRRGCEPGFELVSPPINHNLYSIEDVKLMIESWRHLNPDVNCALKYVATHGIEMVALGGLNAGANRLHISDGCGGTGAAKRVDQKHAGVPVAAVLATVQNRFVEEGVRQLVEISVDGGIQNGEQALKLMLLGADRVGFGTSLLISIGCSMLRKCHLSGPDPSDPTGKRRLGCTPGIATQDPHWIARFAGNSKHVARMLLFVAEEVRERMAAAGIERLSDVIGRRDLLVRRTDLTGKAALLDLSSIIRAAPKRVQERNLRLQSKSHMPQFRHEERSAAERAIAGATEVLEETLTNEDRCVGVGAAGLIARKYMDAGLPTGLLAFKHKGVAGQFYAAYTVEGMSFDITGVVADSCFTASYGGELVVRDELGREGMALVGNAFGYGCRGGRAFIAGRAGNRFGICMRQSAERTGATVVVEGIEACGFQYMTGGTALVLGPVGPNFGSGMTGGVTYLLDVNPKKLNQEYVQVLPLDDADRDLVRGLLETHVEKTGSPHGLRLLASYDPTRYSKVVTKLKPESLE